jgi:hypothetical protein
VGRGGSAGAGLARCEGRVECVVLLGGGGMWVFVFMFAFAPGLALVLGPLAGPVVAGRRLRVWWKRLRRMEGWVVAMVVCCRI